MRVKKCEVWKALEESVKWQSHYAALLNHYDGGSRLAFANAMEWIKRLKKVNDGRKSALSKRRQDDDTC